MDIVNRAALQDVAADTEGDSAATLVRQRRSYPGGRGGHLLVSDASRRAIDNMTDEQVQTSRQAFVGVKRQQRLSMVWRKRGVGPDARETKGGAGRGHDDADDDSLDLEDATSVCLDEDEDDAEDDAPLGQALGALAVSSSDGDEGRGTERVEREPRPMRRSCAAGGVAEEVLATGEPSTRQFYQGLSRRSAIVAGKWKPLSSEWHEAKDKVAAPPAAPEEGRGIGTWWKRAVSSFGSQSSPSQQQPNQAKKSDGAAYFRRGKRKADRLDFLQAVALYNAALVRQREELGENHLDCGATLNEIGRCWMVLGENYHALTALEEALYIRQLCLGAGAPELAETTNNLWMVLHEERVEQDELLEEKGEGEE